MLTQQTKQAITPYFRCFSHLIVQQIVQFSRTYARLAAPDTCNKSKNVTIMCLSFFTPFIVLVPRLPAVAKELAHSGNRYSGGLTLREDLPGRFFTMLTP